MPEPGLTPVPISPADARGRAPDRRLRERLQRLAAESAEARDRFRAVVAALREAIARVRRQC